MSKSYHLLGDGPYACMVRNPDGVSWRLVRMDDDIDMKVNGKPLHIVHYLRHGDRITWCEEEFIFTEGTGSEEAGTYFSRFRKLVIGLACGFVAITTILLLLLGSDDIRQWEMAGLKQSICKISVTDIIYQEVRITNGMKTVTAIDSVFLAEGSCSGTGFFDTKGNFITARHCVEPWIAVTG